jgi:predicted permease
MLQILTVILPLFLIILLSAILQKTHYIGDHWSEVLNELALKIGLPVLLFSALSKTPFSFASQSQIIFINSIFILGSFLLAFLIGKMLRLKKETFRTLFICLGFSNVAYLGFPILTQIYGEKVLPTASLIVAIYLFWLFTVGIGYLDYSIDKNKKAAFKNIFRNIFRNPLLISVILGIVAGSTQLILPSVLIKSLDMITASVTPTVLIVIGLFIGKSKIGKFKSWIPVFIFSILILTVLPACLYFILKLLGFIPNQLSSTIILSAMPLAITPFALADKYNLDKDFIARSIVMSTVLSIITLPFWISIINK